MHPETMTALASVSAAVGMAERMSFTATSLFRTMRATRTFQQRDDGVPSWWSIARKGAHNPEERE